MKIQVETPAREVITLELKTSDKIIGVKQAIEVIEGIPTKQQHLIAPARYFMAPRPRSLEKDQFTLAQYSIQDEDRVYLVDPSKLVQLCVKTLTGKIITLQVKLSDTVSCLKMKIWENENIAVDMQRLVMNGCKLEDDRALMSNGIRACSTLELMLLLTGRSYDQYLYFR